MSASTTERINIFWRKEGSDRVVQIRAAFSGNALILFAKRFSHRIPKPQEEKKGLNDKNGMNKANRNITNNNAKPNDATPTKPLEFATFTGASLYAYRRILEWIEACVANNQVVEFYCPSHHEPYFTGQLVLEAAKWLGIPLIEDVITKKLDYFLSTQVHSDDVRAVYGHYGAGDEQRKVVVECIVKAWWEKKLRGEKFYWDLYEKIEDFRKDVDELWDLEEKKAKRMQMKKAEEAKRIEMEKAFNPDPTEFELSRRLALVTMDKDLARGGSKAAKANGKGKW